MHNRYLIIGAPRTGTNLVAHALAAAAPAVLCFNEVFNKAGSPIVGDHIWSHDRALISEVCPTLFYYIQHESLLNQRFERPMDILCQIFEGSYSANVTHVGIKILYDHIENIIGPQEIFHYLARYKIPVVHLKRRNLLSQYYSLTIAKRTGVWIVENPEDYAPDQRELKLRIRIPELMAYFGMVYQQEKLIESLLSSCQKLDVWYEEAMSNPDAMFDDIKNFLGCREATLRPVTIRQNSLPLPDVIENYDEIVATLEHASTVGRLGEHIDLSRLRQGSASV